MGIIDQARTDVKNILSNTDEFGVSMTFTDPDGNTADLVGLHTKHHMGVNDDGMAVIGKNAHVSVAESDFDTAGYTIRNADGEVDMENHKVTVADNTGNDKTYRIAHWQPDETLGLIVCILGDYAAD